MKTTVLSAIALGALTALALAPADRAVAEPFELNAAQMDSVTGGQVVCLCLVVMLPQTSARDEIMQMPMVPVEGDIMIGLETLPPSPDISIFPPTPGFNR